MERGSTNVYADLGMADAGEMLVKARFATRIADASAKIQDSGFNSHGPLATMRLPSNHLPALALATRDISQPIPENPPCFNPALR